MNQKDTCTKQMMTGSIVCAFAPGGTKGIEICMNTVQQNFHECVGSQNSQMNYNSHTIVGVSAGGGNANFPSGGNANRRESSYGNNGKHRIDYEKKIVWTRRSRGGNDYGPNYKKTVRVFGSDNGLNPIGCDRDCD